ncbi:3-deoxy-manno-octulosonate cytidylyltransferase [Chlamydiales bacterium SCGC AB-751-O23]|jgi:3-deoxy-manno-octulosonate cytidylyltransferase (CMP-KDO synthetase)|nr:3-deoxy-manno-octulosonate cytidylyltransferase [Chlamydiales bacterium SCGC AB-751-O23]
MAEKNESKQNVFGIIPARHASTRFPGKMLADIKGKPLIQWTYENAISSKCFSDVIIATDSEEIFKVCESFNAKVVMTRIDHPTGTDRIIEVARGLDQVREDSIILGVQGDEPFVSKSTFESLISALKEDLSCEMGTSAYILTDKEKINNPSFVKCLVDKNGYALYFSRAPVPYTQKETTDLPFTHLGHLGIYAFRWHFLKKYKDLSPTPLFLQEDLEQLKVLEHGYKIKVVIVQGEEEGLGVNEKEDIKAVEDYLCKQNIF